ncbi:MAG: prepilin-type N-terminal cleavage/methylation domain-containing protein [Chthoniobacterales bacterium]|nr:prepilin-type N-terminal cleavage/methylation domain-containing protein [Chthoniobacterales bacterium]
MQISRRRTPQAFTLAELLVSMAILALLVVLIGQMFNSAAAIAVSGNKQMDAEEEARSVLDRMQIDISQMIKRSDLDYFLKGPANLEAGNDQISFFSQVSGYSSGSPGPISLVSYRINGDSTAPTYSKLQRMGKGLLWNGATTTDTPVLYLPLLIKDNWPAASDLTTADADYDLAGAQVFRFEYWYLLKDGTVSVTPWISPNTAVNGFQDIAAIGAAIALVDPKSKVLVTNAQLVTLAGSMNDFQNTNTPGTMQAQWQGAINASTFPRVALSAMRIYRRYFYLSSGPVSK